MLSHYGLAMADDSWGIDDDAVVERGDVRFRPAKWIETGMKTVAELEHAVRRAQNKPGAVSASKMIESVLKRYLIGYQEEFGPLPDPEDATSMREYVARVVAQRAKKKK